MRANAQDLQDNLQINAKLMIFSTKFTFI